jgi:hypothetical protein
MEPNSHGALLRRREAGTLKWQGPALMLFARAVFAVGAQAVVAAIFVLRASPTPWRDAEPWLPVYGTVIDAGCLGASVAAPHTAKAKHTIYRAVIEGDLRVVFRIDGEWVTTLDVGTHKLYRR